MGIRVTILMATGRFAWSETHWAKGGTTVEGVETDAKRLCKKRAACLAPNGYVVACRASNDALPNDAKLIDLSDMAPQNTLGIGGMPTKETGSFSDIQQTCLMVRINGAVGGRLHQGRILMAGIPDSVVQTNGAGNRIYVPN